MPCPLRSAVLGRGGVVPAYGGACLSSLLPTLLADEATREKSDWLPAPLVSARQVVVLVVDGLGHHQLAARTALAPRMAGGIGGPITSVAPTTTATALTSIVSGRTPAEHGLLGYRLRVEGEVLNVLRWTTPAGDARAAMAPREIAHARPFEGRPVPVVTRAKFAGSGFTEAHLPDARLVGWGEISSLVVETGRLLAAGESLVYAYYDGVDHTAHEHGFGDFYDRELSLVDWLVGALIETMPAGAALCLTADHGQVEVREAPIHLAPEIADVLVQQSGEGRFRWLHTRPGAADAVLEGCREAYGDRAWVATRDEVLDADLFGGRPTPAVAARLGDIALIASDPVAFFDPADSGESKLVCRHGSLTAAEMLVPLLAFAR